MSTGILWYKPYRFGGAPYRRRYGFRRGTIPFSRRILMIPTLTVSTFSDTPPKNGKLELRSAGLISYHDNRVSCDFAVSTQSVSLPREVFAKGGLFSR